jgi:hypothetical protein
MNLGKIIKLFEHGNVCVTGLRGTGKDMLTANVAVRRNIPYLSNVRYDSNALPLKHSDLSLGGNSFKNLFEDAIIPYETPYPDGTDVYISDVGVYYPSQECGYLDKNCKGLPLYMALSRHLLQGNVHLNVQNLERAWTKIREQSDTYIRCEWCKVLGNLVIQKVTIYERPDSCQLRVPPNPYRAPLLCNKEARAMWDIKALDYKVLHGSIKPLLLVYINRSTYDTRVFKKILSGGSNEAYC